MSIQNVPNTQAVINYVRDNVGNWDATVTYEIGDLSIDGNSIYKSLVGSNLNNQPSLDDGSNWELLEKEYADTTAIVFAIALG